MFALDRFLPYRLAVAASKVSRGFAERYRGPFGLSVAEWRVLAHLHAAGAVSVRDLHLRADLEKSKASRAAARLEAAGLVAKAEDARDRRLVSLTLTGAGRETMAALAPLALGYEAELLGRLDAADRAALDRILARLSA